jgi:L-alanine-DL-glutamate epimerase-like enolase superfamily enzyme
MLECIPGRAGGLGLDRFVDGTVAVRDGLAVGPDRPGFGYRLDWAAIRYLAGGGAPAMITHGGR